jgi:hypothetical protein
MVRLIARSRRWLHLMAQLLTLPYYWAIYGSGATTQRAETLYRPVVFMGLPSRRTLTLNETVYLGCTCGRVFWQEKGDPHEQT